MNLTRIEWISNNESTHQNWRVIKVSIDFSAFSISNASNYFDSVDIMTCDATQIIPQPLFRAFYCSPFQFPTGESLYWFSIIEIFKIIDRNAILICAIQIVHGLLLAQCIECINWIDCWPNDMQQSDKC